MAFSDPVGAHRNAGIPLVGATWTDEHLEDDDIAGVILQDCVLEGVHLVRARLERTMFVNCRLDDCVFEDCHVVATVVNDCKGRGLRIVGGEFRGAVFAQCRLTKLELEQSGEGIVMSDSEFGQLAFNGAGLRQQTLTISDCRSKTTLAENARWRSATAVGVELDTWAIANAEFVNCSFIRARGRGTDLSTVTFDGCNLYESDFQQARFRSGERTIFAECDLADANMDEASLRGALFAKANAPGASFQQARLDGALFPGANVAGANFAGASARISVWTDADLTGADLTGIDAYRGIFRNATFRDATLTNARLVETDLHGVEEVLTGADVRDSRGTVDWRAEREKEAAAGAN